MYNSISKMYKPILVVLALAGLYLTSFYSYLLFHSIAELFSIVVAGIIFVIVMNSGKYIGNNYLIILGSSYLFIGFLDLMHTLSYHGMSIFTDYDYYANQIWVATRYLEAFTLLFSFIYLRRSKKTNQGLVMLVYTLLTALILLSIFYWKVFPICFVEGVGLTPFKKISEYVISGILIMNMVLLYLNKQRFTPKVYKYLMLSFAFTVATEITFTLYITNSGFLNLVGHYLKIFAYYFSYEAIIVTAIQEPYDLIFNEIVRKEKQLEEALNQAEVANHLKSEFLANVSHEIRTPMNSIIGFSSILLKDETNKEKSERLKFIKDSGTYLLRLINDILDFSKIEAGKMKEERYEFRPAKLNQDILNTFSLEVQRKSLDFNLNSDFDQELVLIGDEYKLKQVLLNIVGNAVKFTANGGIEISEKYENGQLLVNISDTGIGIPPDKLETIFKAFEQADNSTTRKFGGTGLGLAITKSMVEMMGGTISVTSTVDVGTTFSLAVPLDKAETANTCDLITSNIHCAAVLDFTRPDFMNKRALIQNCLRCNDSGVALLPHSSDIAAEAFYSNLGMVFIDKACPNASSLLKSLRKDFRTEHLPIVLFEMNEADTLLGTLYQPYGSSLNGPLGTLVDAIEANYKSNTEFVSEWLDQLNEIFGSNMPQTLAYVLRDYRHNLSLLAELIAKNETDQLRLLVHTLKGNMVMSRIPDIYAAYVRMEEMILKESYDPGMLKQEYTSLIRLVQKLEYAVAPAGEQSGNPVLLPSIGQVLVVDDNTVNQKLMAAVLERLEIQCDTADNGAEALEKLAEIKYDLVLLDTHMPVMDGLDTLKKIRQNKAQAELPVIMLTANSTEENIKKCYEYGCNDYITKPIDMDKLEKKILELKRAKVQFS